MIGNVNEQPLYYESIDPINHKRIFSTLTHRCIAIFIRAVIVNREKNDPEKICRYVSSIKRVLLVHHAKIILQTSLTLLLFMLPIRQYFRKASPMIAIERTRRMLVTMSSDQLFVVKKQNIRPLSSDIYILYIIYQKELNHKQGLKIKNHSIFSGHSPWRCDSSYDLYLFEKIQYCRYMSKCRY